MAPPSALHITTQSVKRLVKEEASYHQELAGQQARVTKLKADIQAGSPDLDENADFVLRQEETAVAETENIFGPLRQRIADAVSRLEEQIAQSESSRSSTPEELKAAKEALESGKKIASEGERNGAVHTV